MALTHVEEWSLTIHGLDSDRHRWCMAAARAILDDTDVPPWPGGRKATGESRLVTIERLLGQPIEEPAR